MRSGALSWSTDARDSAEADGLTVDEVAAGEVFEVVEHEVLYALDVARVPAGIVEGRRRPSDGRPRGVRTPVLCARPDVVERADDPAHDRGRVGDQAGVETASVSASAKNRPHSGQIVTFVTHITTST